MDIDFILFFLKNTPMMSIRLYDQNIDTIIGLIIKENERASYMIT